jgi:hypothetical protein
MNPANSSVEDAARKFRIVVQQYCDLVAPSPNCDKYEYLRSLFPALAELIHAAALLPQVEPVSEHLVSLDLEPDEETNLRSRISELLGPKDIYWENFDPTEKENDGIGLHSLANDLAEVFSDVKGVLLAFEKGSDIHDVVWEWRFGLETHWGRHAIDALRVVYHRAYM